MDKENTKELLIQQYKKDFKDRTGENIAIYKVDKYKASANFTDKIDFWKVVKMIFDATDWDKKSTFSKSRNSSIVFRRNIIDFIATANGCSLLSIGRFTGRDHTTVMHSIATMKDKLDVNMESRMIFSEIMEFIINNYHLYKDQVISSQDIE